ncbi:hypothetical protein HV436_16900 [Bacillus sporothermodurans]|uniref:Uncharacterized protein n=1 Tax=Heyndrickxia sporothermodurans TaxID=46224 RepID=A0AB37HDZ8_9BACI|nr:hypothetical protein [Heyndrickxia sporothermodurans]MBL5771738.1 hypothetical protein [Heyndrickxia sporothermodurans]MBL5775350.1 hypothetical protein [Heyndrickxia sporothermodurans]MBL5794384.1 hypothetical protein [Heyndrickxia sporothermodurans]MBL5811222.1 hypothetical protein [Heyndrickxia sporothermodurans]MBL5833021.1 hypothetical protein [Heyndrickxia sporothermodurans]
MNPKTGAKSSTWSPKRANEPSEWLCERRIRALGPSKYEVNFPQGEETSTWVKQMKCELPESKDS